MKSPRLASIIVAGLLAVIVVTLWMVTRTSAPPEEVALAPDAAAAAVSEPPAFPPHVAVAMPSSQPPPDLPPPKAPVVHSPEALKDLDNVQFMLRDFRTRLGGNPEGTNAEIMKAVMGGNRAQARLGPPEGQRINEQGELLDRWDTPYFFHQLSRNEMEVRSAGPDRTIYTTDDIVVK